MIVDVRADSEVTLREPNDFTALKVLADRQVDVGAALVQAGVGTLRADGDAALAISWLRRSRPAEALDWLGDFEQMIAYARTRGWVDGDVVQAHVELRP